MKVAKPLKRKENEMAEWERKIIKEKMQVDHTSSIVMGMERSRVLGLTKPHDIAVSVIVQLEENGYKIVRIPRKYGLMGVGKEKTACQE
jgi:hypothetical protein